MGSRKAKGDTPSHRGRGLTLGDPLRGGRTGHVSLPTQAKESPDLLELCFGARAKEALPAPSAVDCLGLQNKPRSSLTSPLASGEEVAWREVGNVSSPQGSLLGGSNREIAAGTPLTSLGKFYPFPDSGGGNRDSIQFKKEEGRKEGLEPTFRLECKDKSINPNNNNNPRADLFFFFFFLSSPSPLLSPSLSFLFRSLSLSFPLSLSPPPPLLLQACSWRVRDREVRGVCAEALHPFRRCRGRPARFGSASTEGASRTRPFRNEVEAMRLMRLYD